MLPLLKKELAGFFSSLIGYLTIAVFLVLTGLMTFPVSFPYPRHHNANAGRREKKWNNGVAADKTHK